MQGNAKARMDALVRRVLEPTRGYEVRLAEVKSPHSIQRKAEKFVETSGSLTWHGSRWYATLVDIYQHVEDHLDVGTTVFHTCTLPFFLYVLGNGFTRVAFALCERAHAVRFTNPAPIAPSNHFKVALW